ncbi:oxidoreductase [Prochlorococcus marinus]|uniref:oxidoreductase n=1 Tax=Prochlorococcus marinus TaxID=1219 RepID=UPI001C5881FA|nr:oxidoreductase [Prochlorococcus marinus]MBW3042340.1 light dependent protochlorophyllide oxido-reductase [Prochlorococcus marinus str. XMU1408]
MVVRLNEIDGQEKRVFLITGANSGLGYETSKFLLGKGATIIMCCRDLLLGERAKQKLLKFNLPGKIELVELDLSDLVKVKNFSDFIKNKFNYLDVLINNAGIMAPPKTLSQQGLEIQFAVNHLAHMHLTLELLPLLKEKDNSRVVTVTSGVQYFGSIKWDDLQGKLKYDRWASYSQSKLANVMFGLELNSKLKESNSKTSSLLAHPGFARTNLQPKSVEANQSWQEELAYKFMDPMFQSAKMGALPQIAAAILPNAKGGEQYGPRYSFRGYPKKCKNAPQALNHHSRKRLWNLSEKLIKIS